MKNFRSHFRFNKQERSGIFFLLLIILLLQGANYYIKVAGPVRESVLEIDTLAQQAWEEVAEKQQGPDSLRIFPFNPNYLTDYKGYILGMSTGEIDRLLAYRKQGKFINTAAAFQQVTLVSDSLLSSISPYFRFPEWTLKKRPQVAHPPDNARLGASTSHAPEDLNTATVEELRRISGIGDVLAPRIVKFRNALGGFVDEDQLHDVYGLDSQVVEQIIQRFKVLDPPEVRKINLNSATPEELSGIIYLKYPVALRIVRYREEVGNIGSFDELRQIEDFPFEKIDRIKLYLTL